ncbi:MAG: preprotein translocase subunit SecG [Microscillaceae bacterium]|jgi:preprotein translocase subunit SecG|nr:preprotein translocase subunit SecG [Microscillaceae bacterium]
MYTFAVVLILLLCVLLIVAILGQNSKGGVSAQFGGQMASQMFGAKKGADILERLTWGFATGVVVLTMATTFLTSTDNNASSSPNIQKAQEKKSIAPINPNPAPKADDKKADDKKSESKSSETKTTTPEPKKEEKK